MIYTIPGLQRKLIEAGCERAELHHAALAWFIRAEILRHTDDIEAVKQDLRNLRDLHGVAGLTTEGVGTAMRDFLLMELSRHESEISKLRAMLATYGKLLISVVKVPLGFVVVEDKEEGSKGEGR